MAPPKRVRGPGHAVRRCFLPAVEWCPPEAIVEPVVGEWSFVVPCYNAAATVEECIHSCFAQTSTGGEVVAVNDGSRDGTGAILAKLKGIYDGRLVVLEQPNLGAAAARNRGTRWARGETVLFCDADDLAPPDRVEKSLQELSTTGAGLVYGQKETFQCDPIVRGLANGAAPPSPDNIIGGAGFGTGTVAFRKRIVLDGGLWLDEQMAGAEDAELLVACLAAGVRVQCSRETLCWLRRDGRPTLSNRVQWSQLRRWIAVKHRDWLGSFMGCPVGVSQEDEAFLRRERERAGTIVVNPADFVPQP